MGHISGRKFGGKRIIQHGLTSLNKCHNYSYTNYVKVDQGNPSFPRPAGYWWFGCQSIQSQG